MREKGAVVTAEEVRRIFNYDPLTGVLTWAQTLGPTGPAGAVAGTSQPGQYLCVQIRNRLYKAHRLIWLYMTGEWPDRHIDHRDSDKLNNRWANLRLADNSENAHNKAISPSCASGFKGVTLRREGGSCWRAAISFHGKIIRLGHFPTAELAHAAYCEAATRLYGEFARVA